MRSGDLAQQVELSEAEKRMRKEKLELAEGLLARLEELKKAREDVSFFCEVIGKRTKENDSLLTQLDQEVAEKLKLRGKV